MLKNGIYEQVINNRIKTELLEAKANDKYIEQADIDEEEAPKILAQYISSIIENKLDNIKDRNGKIRKQIELSNKIIDTLSRISDDDCNGLGVDEDAKQLLAVLEKKNNILAFGNNGKTTRPETSLAQSSLFTGAKHEPSLYSEFKKEILSCNRIDMLVSFIKWSGLRLIIEELKEFTQNGGKLRVITTSYMGATDIKAIEELRVLPNTKIKVSYDTKTTRLHAKTYVFYRGTGFTTAYIGSSNLSNAAVSNGLEWNVKVTEQDLPETIKKISATFENYWNNGAFKLYSFEQRLDLENALNSEKSRGAFDNRLYSFDIKPYNYQQEILDKLEAERIVRGYSRNLLVAATGTGKTVIAAFDYKRFCKNNQGKTSRLLFVAHREEILKQSIECFRGILKNPNFGDLFVGNYKPKSIDHLFVSVQTLNSQDLVNRTEKDFFDYIIIDEFHRAAAQTYQELLKYYEPKILLGLTATPERMDGKDIFKYFSNRIAAEIRLPEAIERDFLCPFQYFGVSDMVDLSKIRWTSGGYDRRQLSNIYTMTEYAGEKRAGLVINSLEKYVTDIKDVKGLGFCVTIEHAKFMADFFCKNGIPSICLTGLSEDNERNNAQQKLVYGDIKFIFVVDLYNEGVDIPEVNTVLFLRPTESLTVFLQQLGRGLRKSEGKECLTVLDFIGQANKRYNFADKFAALLTNNRKGMQREINDGFVSVPKGCFIQLERKAKEYVLDNIKRSIDNKYGVITRIANFKEDSGQELSFKNFLEYYHITAKEIYAKGTFSRLAVSAGVIPAFSEPIEDTMEKAFKRICAIDSRRWIEFLLDLFLNTDKIDFTKLSSKQVKMLQMIQFTVWQKSYKECGFKFLTDGILEIKKNPVMCAELVELLKYNYEKIDFIDEEVNLGFDCPLDLYCSYSRDQILSGMDFSKPNSVREGVKYLKDKKTDIFFITLNKSDKDYSPSTMYNDYSISETLFHWQSQSTTSESSPTGKRYINQQKNGTKILLFVREFKKDGSEAMPYTFLGSASYVSHKGSKPINIVWKLEKPIPAKYLKKTNKLANV
ncbi:MAG: DUF3427 domain-containing protein [Acidaminococcaceae bacterium]|nr:DUF3427 domain-containing protein [Acidaminococcaceae bacterium]